MDRSIRELMKANVLYPVSKDGKNKYLDIRLIIREIFKKKNK